MFIFKRRIQYFIIRNSYNKIYFSNTFTCCMWRYDGFLFWHVRFCFWRKKLIISFNCSLHFSWNIQFYGSIGGYYYLIVILIAIFLVYLYTQNSKNYNALKQTSTKTRLFDIISFFYTYILILKFYFVH